MPHILFMINYLKAFSNKKKKETKEQNPMQSIQDYAIKPILCEVEYYVKFEHSL